MAHPHAGVSAAQRAILGGRPLSDMAFPGEDAQDNLFFTVYAISDAISDTALHNKTVWMIQRHDRQSSYTSSYVLLPKTDCSIYSGTLAPV